MKVRVGFSTTNGWYSRIIRWFINAQVSHTYIRIYDDYLDAPLIIHADIPGVIVEHGDIFDRDNIVIEEFEINDNRLRDGIRKNLRHLKKRYNWWDIFHLALVLKSRRYFKKKLQDPLQDPKKLICVDFVARTLNDAGITHLPLGNLHPKRLRAWFNENYESFGWEKFEIDQVVGKLTHGEETENQEKSLTG